MAIATEGDSSQALTWRGQWLGFLVVGMLVFFTWLPNSYYLMVAYPWILIWQVGFLLLGIWAIWMLRQFHLPFRLLGYGFDWVVGLALVTLILSGIFASFKAVAVSYILMATCYGLFLYVLHNWLSNGWLTIQKLWVGISLAGIVTGVISLGAAIAQVIQEGQLISNSLPLGHRNFVAGYLLLILPLVFALANTKKGWQKLLLWAASLMLLVDLYSTQSRGGILGLLSVLITCSIFWIVKSKGKQKYFSFIISLSIFIIVVSIVLASPRVQQIVNVVSNNDQLPTLELRVDGQTEDRLFMLEAAKNIFQDRPLFGVGLGNMSRVYNLYRPIEVGAGAAHLQQLHNTPIHLLGELGILGLSVYFLFLGCFFCLWIKLNNRLKNTSEIFLLYGIGASLLGYLVSSLTDYQLENISISSTIVIILVLLIGLDKSNSFNPNFSLKNLYRRWLSLGLIILSILAIFVWVPDSYARHLGKAAYRDLSRGDLTKSYEKLKIASDLVPWDPSYDQMIGLQVWNAESVVKDRALADELKELAKSHFTKAVKTAPNDAWFNHNLGIVYRDSEPDRAEIYFSRTIQLQPRDNAYYDYYYLGKTYLEQGKIERAIDALALQGLVMPEFLTYKLWLESPFINIHAAVLKETLNLLEKLLKEIPITDTNYQTVYENIALLRWWYKLAIDNLDLQKFRPIVRALFLANNSSQQSLNILDREITLNSQAKPFLLLRAWLEPKKYFLDGIDNLSDSDRTLISESILENRDLKTWLTSIKAKLENSDRVMDMLVYRNPYISPGKSILVTKDIEPNFIVTQLELFPTWTRSFPSLERLIEQVKGEKLLLPHLTKN